MKTAYEYYEQRAIRRNINAHEDSPISMIRIIKTKITEEEKARIIASRDNALFHNPLKNLFASVAVIVSILQNYYLNTLNFTII